MWAVGTIWSTGDWSIDYFPTENEAEVAAKRYRENSLTVTKFKLSDEEIDEYALRTQRKNGR